MQEARRARIIRVPFGMGANKYPGLALGPAAIERLARRRLREFQLDAAPDSTRASFPFWLETNIIKILPQVPGDPQDDHAHLTVQHLPTVLEVCLLLRDTLSDVVKEEPARPLLPIILGGDHSVAIGSLAGIVKAAPDKKVGVVWIDSHADYNTGFLGESFGKDEYRRWWDGKAPPKQRQGTTTTGRIHGMPLAVATGRGDPKLTGVFEGGVFIDPQDIAFIGLRDLDREERDLLADDGAFAASARAIEYRGVAWAARSAVRHLADRGVDLAHISVDIDVIEGTLVPGTGTRVPGGLSFREADLLLKLLRDWLPEAGIEIACFELVEVNPIIDREGRTSRLAARLLCSFLGEEILAGERFPFEE